MPPKPSNSIPSRARKSAKDLQLQPLSPLAERPKRPKKVVTGLEGGREAAAVWQKKLEAVEQELEAANRIADSKKNHEAAAATLRAQLKKVTQERDEAYQMVIDCGRCPSDAKEKARAGLEAPAENVQPDPSLTTIPEVPEPVQTLTESAKAKVESPKSRQSSEGKQSSGSKQPAKGKQPAKEAASQSTASTPKEAAKGKQPAREVTPEPAIPQAKQTSKEKQSGKDVAKEAATFILGAANMGRQEDLLEHVAKLKMTPSEMEAHAKRVKEEAEAWLPTLSYTYGMLDLTITALYNFRRADDLVKAFRKIENKSPSTKHLDIPTNMASMIHMRKTYARLFGDLHSLNHTNISALQKLSMHQELLDERASYRALVQTIQECGRAQIVEPMMAAEYADGDDAISLEQLTMFQHAIEGLNWLGNPHPESGDLGWRDVVDEIQESFTDLT
ncbi:Golgin imh1 [Saxophila tyrrhenica]|uniref:Golgin imh1 n=1 Tax=Saxophila tyrrhenica TaxID=1690608 RepID=A0AAV9PAC4_9PEZI|nr:Golgin imh1 [Saxophila tyrrhenica]